VDDDEVPLRPPIEVMRPMLAKTVPAESALSGGAVYQPKYDGWRLTSYVLPGRIALHTRSGREVASHFPEVADAMSRSLETGVVLDGEVVAHADGALVFPQLAGSPASRRAAKVAVAYVVFDLLAYDGRDIRGLPLTERLELLDRCVASAGPTVQASLSTRKRAEAIEWMHALAPMGIEGLVIKAASSRYDPRSARSWQKYRRSQTVDGVVVGVLGPPSRPRGLVQRFVDGQVRPTTIGLTPIQARQVAEATPEAAPAAGPGGMRGLDGEELVAEVELGDGRHGRVRFVRLRCGD
jgi:ATP-dependent DNA ligase